MYRGFNLDIAEVDLSKWFDIGNRMHENNKAQVERKLESFKDNNGNLLASRIIASWFPPVEADVFLSHSHRDAKQVIGLSGWLLQELGLTSFIDSCIWGYSEDLLRIIDKEYCYRPTTNTYSYEKRNRSTSHVHMMLSTALAKMINGCECIIFVNTPQSISPAEYIEDDDTTNSPWIYSEIAMTSLVQKRTPAEHRGIMIKARMALDEAVKPLNIRYPVDMMHLTPMSVDNLNTWAELGKRKSEALDALYGIMV